MKAYFIDNVRAGYAKLRCVMEDGEEVSGIPKFAIQRSSDRCFINMSTGDWENQEYFANSSNDVDNGGGEFVFMLEPVVVNNLTSGNFRAWIFDGNEKYKSVFSITELLTEQMDANENIRSGQHPQRESSPIVRTIRDQTPPPQPQQPAQPQSDTPAPIAPVPIPIQDVHPEPIEQNPTSQSGGKKWLLPLLIILLLAILAGAGGYWWYQKNLGKDGIPDKGMNAGEEQINDSSLKDIPPLPPSDPKVEDDSPKMQEQPETKVDESSQSSNNQQSTIPALSIRRQVADFFKEKDTRSPAAAFMLSQALRPESVEDQDAIYRLLLFAAENGISDSYIPYATCVDPSKPQWGTISKDGAEAWGYYKRAGEEKSMKQLMEWTEKAAKEGNRQASEWLLKMK